MKTLGVHKAVSIFEMTKLEPIYKANRGEDGKYTTTVVGKREVPLIERGQVGIYGFYIARKTSLKKQMWAIWRLRRSRAGQLRLM